MEPELVDSDWEQTGAGGEEEWTRISIRLCEFRTARTHFTDCGELDLTIHSVAVTNSRPSPIYESSTSTSHTALASSSEDSLLPSVMAQPTFGVSSSPPLTCEVVVQREEMMRAVRRSSSVKISGKIREHFTEGVSVGHRMSASVGWLKRS